MMNKVMRLISRIICTVLAMVMVISNIPVSTWAEEDPFIVVSMGDSYSSGESIEPYYGQDKEETQKVEDTDWLAHRSQKSWPGQLKFQEAPKTMSWYRVPPNTSINSDTLWYFVASSAATTWHYDHEQNKEYDREMTGLTPDLTGSKKLKAQTAIFADADIKDKVDYVTMTIGGNDVGFSKIVMDATVFTSHLYVGDKTCLQEKFDTLWGSGFNDLVKKLVNAYKSVKDKAGAQAEIIVAGYPKLMDPGGRGPAFNKDEATLINTNVSKFNLLLQDIITTLSGNSNTDTQTENHERIEKVIENLSDTPIGPINIHFVDVEEAFNGHEAYSVDENGDDDAWLEGLIFPAKDEDLDHDTYYSKSSMHPTDKGAQVYAKCVNDKIKEIEERKGEKGILSGKVVEASDRTTPVTTATINVVKGDATTTFRTNSDGTYTRELPVGTHYVKVVADGYIEFNAYADIEKDQTKYMETFLMVQGEEGQVGEARGTVTNALTGTGVEGVTLDVRKDWNNNSIGDILTTITTDSNGDYMVNLPIGNYTLNASKDGYVSTMINIVVQPNMSTKKDGSMTPIVSGNNFRIVLTWGENPADLDSHVVGSLSSGNSFHVYYADMYANDNDGTTVCKLDVDDTTSFGPETITLQTVTDSPYYYYIHHYSGSGSISTSEAQIKVYQGEHLIKTFNAPTNLGTAIYWNVFAIVDGELVIRNTITSSPDTSYAGASTVSLMTAELEADTVNSPKKTLDTVEEATVAAEEQEITPEETAATIVEEVLIEKMVTEEPTEAAEESVSEASEEAEADPAVEEIDAEEVIEPEA